MGADMKGEACRTAMEEEWKFSHMHMSNQWKLFQDKEDNGHCDTVIHKSVVHTLTSSHKPFDKNVDPNPQRTDC
jgi:hypothetical protein